MIEGNLLIRASAGTGKTFALATRFIRLMLFDNVEPERIVALTFSRAAAQEIYTKLLERLWKAAETPEGAEDEHKNLIAHLPADKVAKIDDLPIAWTTGTFAELLRKVVAVQHLGAIATLDSFILRLVGNFPLEMGFQNAVQVLDPAGEKDEIDRAAKSILGRAEDTAPFAEAFRAAKKGSFSRMCARTLGDMMEREGWRKFILEHPECKAWTVDSMAAALGISEFAGFADISETETGKVRRDLDSQIRSARDPRAQGATECARGVTSTTGSVTAARWLQKFIDYLVSVEPGENPIPSGSNIAIEFAQAVARHPNEPYVEHQKKLKDGTKETERCEFPQSVFTAAHADLCRLADAYLRRQLEIVEAKIKLFAIIEKEYDTATRRTGKLTFQDFTNAAKDSSNLELDNLRFRFDAKLDHWALDEFQDTSEVQWACLNSLVESAASGGSSQSRSVIAVGDLKQSIYTWRGGDDKPFEEMMSWPWFGTDDDGTVYGRIENSKTSYRYGKRIADFINRVFGPDNLRKSGLIPETRSAAVERWLREDCWMEHEPQYWCGKLPHLRGGVGCGKMPHLRGGVGCGKLPHLRGEGERVPKVQDYVKVVGAWPDDDPETSNGVLPALYREIAPVWAARAAAGSSETIGILVRRNEDGSKIAEYLRKKGLPVVWEGMNAVSDVPVVQAVLYLLKLAEHPQDTFAWTTVHALLPVREILFPTTDAPAAVSSQVSELLSHQGLARTLKDFCGTLCREENGLDGLSRSRLRALVRLGVDYERRKAADYGVDGFARFVAAAGQRESAASSNAIRILSIHRSKGLTLDRVYVPLFEGDKSSIVEPTAFSSLFGKGRQWVLPHLSADVAALNAETHAVLEEQRDARLLEQLRLYYVALTRSRKALTVVFPREDHHGLLFRDLITKAIDAFEEKRGAASCRTYGERSCESGMILFEDGVYPAFKGRDAVSSESADGSEASSRDWPHPEAGERIQRRSPSRLAHADSGCGKMPHLRRGGILSPPTAPTADTLFGESYGSSAKHGVDVHALYAQIEWIDPGRARSPSAPLAELEEKIMSTAFRSAFVKPSPDATVWRERSYELFVPRPSSPVPHPSLWETGQFDRVVFTGAVGNRSATIYDFKTNAMEPGESADAFAGRMSRLYSAQMASYRQSLHRLTQIPLDRIVTRLLLATTGQSVEV